MKIKSLKLKNFRSYRNEVCIDFSDLTAFIGKNDIGKSSILEALDIFFNDGKGIIKIGKDDINKNAEQEGDNDIVISASFDEMPDTIIIDSTNETALLSEYLLNSENRLEIIKKFPNAKPVKVFIKAYHPNNPACNELLLKKDSDLKSILERDNIPCDDKNRKAVMRNAIWNHYSESLQLEERELDVTQGETKTIWDKLQTYLPVYSLFQSDRKNSDGDSEVQDPLKEAVKQILNNDDLQNKLNEVATEVENKLKEVSQRTLEKLREMSPDIANSLNPVIPPSPSLKWVDVFKNVSITGDNDIPINKRGSGVKRLVLLNFFRAEAERKCQSCGNSNVIYAIEEPETSQHTENQQKLVSAFKDLAALQNTQVIITTHSASIVKALDFSDLYLIYDDGGTRSVSNIMSKQLPYTSLNEVNFLAFSEVTEEYHNELYGFIESGDKMGTYKNGKPQMTYKREPKGGGIKEEQLILSEYIRHQIHHPENKHNRKFTFEELKKSISEMRDFIQKELT